MKPNSAMALIAIHSLHPSLNGRFAGSVCWRQGCRHKGKNGRNHRDPTAQLINPNWLPCDGSDSWKNGIDGPGDVDVENAPGLLMTFERSANLAEHTGIGDNQVELAGTGNPTGHGSAFPHIDRGARHMGPSFLA